MQRVYFLGKLAGANRKEAAEIVRNAGQSVATRLDAGVNIVVVGEESLLAYDWDIWNDQLDADTRDAFEKGILKIITETQFWTMYNGQTPDSVQTFYTPSMLAALTGLPLSSIRQLQREGLINPVNQFFRLFYFDKEVLLPLKLAKNMLDSGHSAASVIGRLRKMMMHKPERFSSVLVEGKDIIFVSEAGKVDQNGQKRLPFADHVELTVLDSVFRPDRELDVRTY